MTNKFGFLKRGISLMAVVMVLMAMFATNVFAATVSDCSSSSDSTCKIIERMYGKDSDVTKGGYSDTQAGDYFYAMDITDSSGSQKTIYLKVRPSTNDVSATMKDGKLQVYGMGDGGGAGAWNQFFAKYKSVIVGISGVGAITFIALFIIQFMKLGASAGNPQARSQALTGCLWTGIAAAALGAVSIIAGFFYNAV